MTDPRTASRVAAIAAIFALAAPATQAAAAPATSPAPPPPAAPAPVVLDPIAPDALASDGPRVAWLRGLRGGGQALVVRDTPTSAERVVVPRLRITAVRLAIGTDGAGRPTAVLGTGRYLDPDTVASRPTTGALYAVRLDGTGGPRLLAASRATGPEVAPGLRRGVLSFARVERRDGMASMTLRVGSLTRTSSRVLWTGSPDRPIMATAVGAGRRVVFTTHASPGDFNVWNLRVARPSAPTRSLERLPSGISSNAGYGPLTVAPDGLGLAVSRWESNGDGGVLSRNDLRSGRRTSARSFGEDLDLAVPVGTLGVVAYRTNIFASCATADVSTGRDACPLTFLPARG